MSAVGQYILTVTAAAVIVSVVYNIVDSKSPSASYIRLIGGLFLAVTVISPLLKLQSGNFTRYYSAIVTDADAAVNGGIQSLNSQKLLIIKEQTEAYILERAESLAANITVDVVFSEDDEMIPTGVRIHGAVSPYVKRQLTDIISKELGIPEEWQEWY